MEPPLAQRIAGTAYLTDKKTLVEVHLGLSLPLGHVGRLPNLSVAFASLRALEAFPLKSRHGP
jgi:hypothetical protein